MWVSAGAATVAALVSLFALYRGRKTREDAEERSREHRRQQEVLSSNIAEIAQAIRETAPAPEPAYVYQVPDVVEWRVEHANGVLWRLRNTGTETATTVRVSQPEGTGIVRFTQGVEISPGESAEVQILSVEEIPGPGHLIVECDQLDQPVNVPIL